MKDILFLLLKCVASICVGFVLGYTGVCLSESLDISPILIAIPVFSLGLLWFGWITSLTLD